MIIPAADKMASLPDQLTIKHLIPLTLLHQTYESGVSVLTSTEHTDCVHEMLLCISLDSALTSTFPDST